MGLRPRNSCQEDSPYVVQGRAASPKHPDSLSRMSSRYPDVSREERSNILGAGWGPECCYLSPNMLIFKFLAARSPLLTSKLWRPPLCTLSVDRGLCPYKPRGCHHHGLSMLSWGAASPKPMSVWCRSSQTAPCAVYIYNLWLGNKQLSDSTQFPWISSSVFITRPEILQHPVLSNTSTNFYHTRWQNRAAPQAMQPLTGN